MSSSSGPLDRLKAGKIADGVVWLTDERTGKPKSFAVHGPMTSVEGTCPVLAAKCLEDGKMYVLKCASTKMSIANRTIVDELEQWRWIQRRDILDILPLAATGRFSVRDGKELVFETVTDAEDTDATWVVLASPKMVCDMFTLLTWAKGDSDATVGPAFDPLFIPGVCRKMASILKVLHDNSVSHGDVSLENWLVTPSGGLALFDFGFTERHAYWIEGKDRTKRVPNLKKKGKLVYMAPEVMFGKDGSDWDPFRADVFALGISFLMILTNRTPPYCNVSVTLYTALLTNIEQWLLSECKLNLQLVNVFGPLLQGMLHPNPRKRWSLDRVLEEPALTDPSSMRMISLTRFVPTRVRRIELQSSPRVSISSADSTANSIVTPVGSS